MRTTSPFLFAALLSAPLAAQAESASCRFVPADAQFVARIPSPAKCRALFRGTSIERLWSSAAGKKIAATFTEELDEDLAEMRAKEPRVAEIYDALWSQWKGDFVLGVRVDLEGMARGVPPRVAMSVTLTGDGEFDFAPHAAVMTDLMEETVEGKKLDLEAGGLTLRSFTDDQGNTFTFPQLVDGQLVAFVGTDLEKDLAGFVAAEARHDGPSGSALAARLDLAPVVKKFREALAEDFEGAPFDVDTIVDSIGLAALTTLDLSIAPAGERVGIDLGLGVGAGDRGLFGRLIGQTSSKRMLRLLPADSESFSTGAFPVGSLVEWAGGLVDQFAPVSGTDWSSAQETFAETFKVRLVEDLVAHLGTEALFVDDPNAVLENEDEDSVDGTFMAMELRDGKAFGVSLEKLIRSRGLHVARKTEEYGSTKLHRMNFGGLLEVEYGVTDDLLLIAFGKSEAARRSLRAVLDSRTQPAEGELPTSVQKRLAELPDDWAGFGVLSLSPILEAGARAGEEAALGFGVDPEDEEIAKVLSMFRDTATELKRLGIDALFVGSYAAKNRLELRYRW